MRKPRIRKRIYLSWLISYGVVMLCSLLASLLIYSSANDALNTEISKVETAVLKSTQNLLDNRLDEIILTASILQQDNNLKKFVHDTFPFYKPELAMTMATGKSLMTQSVSNSLAINEIYLYSLRSGVTLSTRFGINDNNAFELPTQEIFGLSYDQYVDMINNVGSQPTYEILPPKDDSNVQQVVLLYPIFNNSIKVEGVLVLKLEPNFLMQIQTDESTTFNLIILGRENQLISANTDASYLDQLQLTNLSEGSQVILKDGVQYLVSTTQSTFFNWKYIAVSNLDVFQGSLRSVRDRTILLFLGFLILGSMISILLVRRNYSPIRNLLSRAAQISGGKSEKDDNEFQQLETVIQDIFVEKEKYSKLLEHQRIHMQTVVLNRLIKGRILTLDQAKEMLLNEEIEFRYSHFVVVIMVIEDFGVLLDTEEEDPSMTGTIELSQVIVKNILEELFAEKMAAKVFEADNNLACLINLNPDEHDMEQVVEVLNHGLTAIRQYFNMVISAGVSSIHENFIGVTSCYQEATDILEWTRSYGAPGEVALFDSRRSNASKLAQHVMHLESRRLLLNYLMVENFEAAEKITQDFLQILEIRNPPNAYRFIAQNGIIEDLSAALEYLCGEQASLRHPAADALIAELQSAESLSECRRLIQAVFAELIAIREEKDQFFQHDLKLNQIRDYVDQNLSDYNLSVTGLAKSVNLSVSKVARIIRSKLGISTLDYIQKTRIEMAKKMLVETDLNINEISRRVGYENFRTLNTIFKKVEGITGTQYRENARKIKPE